MILFSFTCRFVGGFFHGDTRWSDPSDVAVGATSGSFYGVDCYRSSIMRASPLGTLTGTYDISAAGNFTEDSNVYLGVCESSSMFVITDGRTGMFHFLTRFVCVHVDDTSKNRKNEIE